ncbi:hypothetical protein SNOG_14761 [Parastagonospora nodorum SN15]|uniref:Uncharacterized protein n=1 Tax=Phaeosphaeria nodorum (strain SN15 / ATCC MYA-4574 / FGSC 10173) TaxID=321614 RepID=Q0U0P3_PHANO|nr:hypothetical protein SNOG_14761 [Parastagonospora nodorum SN15]EAT77953.1 hypothetical protein SNOG_14761 [Parastagonospora nodorum SN15]
MRPTIRKAARNSGARIFAIMVISGSEAVTSSQYASPVRFEIAAGTSISAPFEGCAQPVERTSNNFEMSILIQGWGWFDEQSVAS